MLDRNQTSRGSDVEPEVGRDPIDVLADSFLSRLRRGEYPAISEYADKHPELADEIRSVFPTLAMLEKGGEELTDDPTSRPSKSMPARVGEYEILSEVGRGGMGVVYEAEHETMRRRVALKVLPGRSNPDSTRLRRFHLEARVAGRLHHSNIVPVFEVGSDGDCHYYAMQFIQGQSLDVIFNELRQTDVIGGLSHSIDLSNVQSADASLGKSVAANLVSGQFQSTVVTTKDLEFNDVKKTQDGQPVSKTDDKSPAKSDTTTDAKSSSSQSVLTNPSRSSTERDDYYRRVARIGLQVADALAYAHGHGILHRDIKPSNIILDTAGVAWVTDFGLAKDADGDLTRSGDLVGTFRYMAPERFSGRTDLRSDVYGLGLTLYELCTLRNSFRSSDRASLVREVCETTPTPPRKVNPLIPLDLETIILKAIEKRPSDRYQTARNLAEDIRLFLDDHPVKARRSSIGERTWRWCRRNPQQAVLAVCVLMLLSIVTVGSLSFAYVVDRKSQELSDSNLKAQRELYSSLRSGSEATRWSGRVGQHFSSLEQIRRASEILPHLGWTPSEMSVESFQLRNAAIAAISLPDVRVEKTWTTKNAADRMLFRPDYKAYAYTDHTAVIRLHHCHDDRVFVRLPAPEANASVTSWLFSSDGRFLAVTYRDATGSSMRVWDTQYSEPVVVPDFVLPARAAYDFDLARQRIVVARGRELYCFSLTTGEIERQIQLRSAPTMVSVCAATGDIVTAQAYQRWVEVSFAQPSNTRRFDVQMAVHTVRWHPRIPELALGGQDGSLSIFRPGERTEQEGEMKLQRTFEGHSSRVTSIHFSPTGRLMLSTSWDGTCRLWNANSTRQMLRMERHRAHETGFGQPNGNQIGFYWGNEFRICEMTSRSPLRILQHPESVARRWSVNFHPSGRWLASAKNDGIEIWDVVSGEITDQILSKLRNDGNSKDARFTPDGTGLMVSNVDGVALYAFESGRIENKSSPNRITKTSAAWSSMTEAGTSAAVRDGVGAHHGVVMSLDNPADRVRFGPHLGMDHIEISPDGRYIATSTWGGEGGIHLWDAKTGKQLTEQPLLPHTKRANIAFSPDSQQLFATTPEEHVAWDIDRRKVLFGRQRASDDGWAGPVACSPDGRLLAVAHSRFVVKVIDSATGQDLGILDIPGDAGFHDCSFSLDGRLLACASDTDLYLWDIDDLRHQLQDIDLNF